MPTRLLVVVAIVNTVVPLFCHLRLLAPTVIDDARRPGRRERRAVPALAVVLAASAVAVAGLGVAAQSLLEFAQDARAIAP